MHNRRAIPAIDVQGRRVVEQGEVLLRILERRIDAPFGGRQSNHPRVGLIRRKRQKEVRVDRQLRTLLPQKLDGRLADDFARASGRRKLEAAAG